MTPVVSDIPTDNNDIKVESTEVANDNINNDNNKSNNNENEKKRGRGRPPGSKNKPKTTPVVGGVEQQVVVEVEVEAGQDVVSRLSAYARSCGMTVCVLQASGVVSGFRLLYHQSSYHPLTTLTTNWELLTLSGVVFPLPTNNYGLTATMADPNTGHVIGGRVEDRLVARTPVSIFLATFPPLKPTIRLGSGSGSGSASGYYPNPGWSNGITTTIQNQVTGPSPGLAQDPPSVWSAQSYRAPPTPN